MAIFRHLFEPWTWSMAWRDSRRERRRLAVFSLSILFGIAALVAVGSLNRNLGDAVDGQARELLGADLLLGSRRPFLPEHDPVRGKPDPDSEAQVKAAEAIAAIPGERAIEVSFTTMVYFPRPDGSTLVNIRATDPVFPFFGSVATDPPEAWAAYSRGEGVVLEASLAEQFGVEPGEAARFGEVELPVLGVLSKAPPQASAFAAFAPQVFFPRGRVVETGLLGDRSLAFYRAYYRVPAGVDAGELVGGDNRDVLGAAGVRSETVESRKRRMGRILDTLASFFSLIGFVALLLGGLGIASAVHVHVTRRLKTVATLRCLGSSPAQATAVFLAQGIGLAVPGAVLGAAAGVALQQWVPRFFRDQLPLQVELGLVWPAIGTGFGIGFLVCICFTLIPLLAVRRVSPLAALRTDFSAGPSRRATRDPAVWAALAVLLGSLALLGWVLSPPRQPWLGFSMIGGIAVMALVLALGARGLMRLARLAVRPSWPYALRQGTANLYRPRNQTTLFLLTAGLGVCLVLSLALVQRMLVEQLGVEALEGKADTFLIDVQADQRDGVVEVFDSLGLELVEESPMISMRLSSIDGKDLSEIQSDRETRVPRWVLRRDFRSTYRPALTATEELVRGEWVDSWDGDGLDEPVPVSVEEGIARDLKIDLGDTFGMDVQGLDLELEVANIRKVDWESLGLNFFIVFPPGVLEDAPSFNVMTTQTTSDEVSGALNREIVKRFPNITVFDASLVLDTLLSIAERAAWVIRFMAMFTVLTGVVILVGTLLAGKRERVRESVLLRTLGASRADVWKILVTEYCLLGFVAALSGAVLALAGSWALARFVFEVEFLPQLVPVLVAVGGLTGATLAVGIVLSRGVTSHPPLAILRADS